MPKRIDAPNRVFCDGNVVLKKRKGSSYWQAHMKVRGKWIRESTGTTVLRDAKEWAIEQHGKMMYRVQHRQVPRTKLVRDTCDQYRMDLDANLRDIPDLTPDEAIINASYEVNIPAQFAFRLHRGRLTRREEAIGVPLETRSLLLTAHFGDLKISRAFEIGTLEPAIS
ncbi:MAG: hypothetical protein EPN26_05460 [Rhodospirillales bacterium]|nr:MAG: hypothetical protein EPN26_05460 [Rhodospirillales bacterium]